MFVRVPCVSIIGESVKVFASVDGNAIFIRQNNVLAYVFNPELIDDQGIR